MVDVAFASDVVRRNAIVRQAAAPPQLTGIVGERPLGRLAEAALTKLSTSVLKGMASRCRDRDGAKEISMARRMVRPPEAVPTTDRLGL